MPKTKKIKTPASIKASASVLPPSLKLRRTSRASADKSAGKKKTVKKAKKAPAPKKVEVKEKPSPAEPEKYWGATGRRKTSLARVRLFAKGEKIFLVNDKPCNVYFPTLELQKISQIALEKMNCLDKFRVSTKVKGGGLHGQAEAVRHGTARALILFNPDFRKRLKKSGFLTRDPRMRERKKFGLKRARRAPQWAKR